MASKAKSSAETPKKASPATPKVSKPSGGVARSESDLPSSLPKPRVSIDRSPRSISSKSAVDRHSPKVTTPPEKPQTRLTKGSELQTQLNLVQEDLKKAKEQIVQLEKEKDKAFDELKEAQKASEEANEKLKEALLAQKRAEENSEIEKFRALELEQFEIEAAQKKQEEWQNELEAVKNQHALDISALLSTTQELERAKQELAMTCDAKNQALSHADDATKIAEIHAEREEILSAEIVELKTLLDSKLKEESIENEKLVLKLKSEIESLTLELEKAKCYKEKFIEKVALIEKLNVELEAAKMAESYAYSIVEEWKNRVEELEMKIEEANKLERSASESLETVLKQLEGNSDLLHNAEAQIATLKEKVGLLEMTVKRQRGDLEDSVSRFNRVKEEASEVEKKVKKFKSELEIAKEEKIQALNNEKLAASSVQALLEEKDKLINELESSKNEEEKCKKAMESLASALHEVSAEAREAKEKLLSDQAELENYESQMEDLKLVLKATNEKCENILDDAKHEIDLLTSTIEKSKLEFDSSKAEWEETETHLVNSVKKLEEEKTSMEKEVNSLINLLKQTEEEACSMKEEEAELRESLKEVESEVIYLQETLGEAKAESMKLKENLLERENELQIKIQENEDLKTREEDSLKKIEELSKLLKEASAKKPNIENGDLTDGEKEYDLLPKVVEFSEENGHKSEENPKIETPPPKCDNPTIENSLEEENAVKSEPFENVNGKIKEDEGKVNEGDSVEVEYKMWESCKIEKKEFSPDREPEQEESFEEEGDSKGDGGDSFDQINGETSIESVGDGGISLSKEQHLKKKKPLLKKFGNLLKKKSTSNTK